MGFVFRQTPELDAGIDGTIEIRDPTTTEVKNLIIQVQSKATTDPFTAETEQGFTYLCSEADLDYWMSGNMPVILVVSRPENEVAYWISVKDYFRDLEKRRSRKIYFDKNENSLNKNSASDLLNLAAPKNSGVYFATPKINEILYTNLLTIKSFAPKIYVAQTEYRERSHVYTILTEYADNVGSEWVLKSGQIFSFHDLRFYPWEKVCDIGTIEEFDSEEWAFTDDKEKRYEFVQLLKLSLNQKLWQTDVRFDKQLEHYYFIANKDLSAREIRYQGKNVISNRTVVQGYNLGTKYAYYRHLALEPKFQYYNNAWYLELNPTYRFTNDGYSPHRFYETLLSNMRRIDRNAAMKGQVAFWANYLSMPEHLFRTYPFLTFDDLLTFDVDFGIPEKSWQQDKLEEEADDSEKDIGSLSSLF
jgi:hypothetical protein